MPVAVNPEKPPFDWDRPLTAANLAKKIIFDRRYRFFVLSVGALLTFLGSGLYLLFAKRE